MAQKITERQYYLVALVVVGLFIVGALIVKQVDSGVNADEVLTEPRLPEIGDTSTDFAPDIFAEPTVE